MSVSDKYDNMKGFTFKGEFKIVDLKDPPTGLEYFLGSNKCLVLEKEERNKIFVSSPKNFSVWYFSGFSEIDDVFEVVKEFKNIYHELEK